MYSTSNIFISIILYVKQNFDLIKFGVTSLSWLALVWWIALSTNFCRSIPLHSPEFKGDFYASTLYPAIKKNYKDWAMCVCLTDVKITTVETLRGKLILVYKGSFVYGGLM